MKIWQFDIDNTICNTPEGNPPDYSKATPRQEMVDKINKLYDEGHTINIWTARGATQGNERQLELFNLAIEQLDAWGVKRHQVSSLKPTADFYVDDKAMKPDELLDFKLTPGYLKPASDKSDPYAPVWDIQIDAKHEVGEETMHPEKYFSHHMVDYEEPESKGFLCLEVLPFLKGRKWDVIALGYVHSLRPSSIRVTKGVCTCDACTWRVTVVLDETDTIKSIEQEAEVGLPAQCAHGDALQSALHYGLDSEQVKWHALPGGTFYDGIETHTAYKMVPDGDPVPFPSLKYKEKK